jgi:hypothetical protein
MKTTQIIKLAAVAVLAVFLAGCAATGAKYAEASKSMPAMKAGEGRVYFIRSGSMFGAAIQPDLRLNGQVVGASKPGGFFYVDRPAGNYSASATTETEKTLSFNLRAGETKYVRSAPAFGLVVGRINLDLEQADKAQAELQMPI